ncbi:MAG TPA: choice-of-anchor D domain-containing protein, partial [Pyrinomonadaceae bacterium]
TENMTLITDLALRRRQTVPPCELGPCIKVNPLGGKFTDQTIDTQKRIALVVENRGKPPLKVDTPVLEGANSSDFEVSINNCAKPVERLCELNIAFKPSATGPRIATLRIPSDGANVPTEVLLYGTGMPPPLEMKIDATADSTSFPIQKVGTTTTRQVVLRNTGRVPLQVDEISIDGAGKTAFVSQNQCSNPIAPNETCAIEVTFGPQSPEGFTAKLTIIADEADPAATVVRTFTVPPVELKGTGAVPIISTNQTDLCFGKQRVVKESDPLVRQALTLTIFNGGVVPLTVSDISVNNEDFKIVDETCKAGDVTRDCRVTVGFTPRKSHLREGVLTITHDDKKAGATKIPLKGAGKARDPVSRFFQWIFNRPENPCK